MRARAAALVAAWVLGSCGAPAPAFDRAGILRTVTSDVIVPGYQRLDGDVDALSAQVTTLCAAPTPAELALARTAWSDSFSSFERTAAYGVGPARATNFSSEVGFWPISPTAIERNIAGTTAIDGHYVDSLGAASKGFQAMAYLLYGGAPSGAALTDDAIVAGFMATARRCAYLVALADHLHRNTTALLDAWSVDGGNYAETFSTAGQSGNTTWPDQTTALVELYTQMLDTLKSAKNTKLGIPIGHRTMMTSPNAVEAPWGSASVAAMQANVRGVRDVWAPSGPSFDGFLRSRDPALAGTMLGELAAAEAGLSALHQVAETPPSTLSMYAAGTDHAVGETAYSRIDAAELSLSTDVAAALALSVAFSDMDGD